MAKGGGSAPTQQTVTQTNLPEYARPYFEGLMQRSQSLLSQDYTPYGQERIAGFTPEQQQVQQNILGMQTPGQFGTATGLVSDAARRSITAGQYGPGQFAAERVGAPALQQYRMAAPRDVVAQTVAAQDMQAAQTGFRPDLQYFQMAGPERFGGQQAAQYMSPFVQQALEPQMREAITSARRGQVAQDLGAARQGTYGGSRQVLAAMERERNLGQQLGDIQSRGLQAAYESAQAQFERDRAAQQQAQQANLQAMLGVQQLGTQTGLQVALANLTNEQQARVNNQALQFQAQGMNAENALRAALANQQAELTVGQQNLGAQLQTQQLGAQQAMQAALANQQQTLEAQRMGEQSRQFGANLGLQGLAQAGQMGQTLTNIGTAQAQADQARLGLQTQTAAQQQALNQQYLDTAYQDFLRQRDYPLEMLQQYSSLLRGVPVEVGSTRSTYAQQPGIAQQLLGTGLSAASIYNTFSGGR